MRKNESSSSASGSVKPTAGRKTASATGKPAAKAAGKASPPAAKSVGGDKAATTAVASKVAAAPVKAPAAPAARASAGKAKAAEKAVAPASAAKPAAKPAAPVVSKPAGKHAPAHAAPAKPAAAAETPAERGKAQAHVSDLSPKVIHLIAEEMAVEEAELTPSASFRDDLSLDEIDVAELLVRAEETFGLKQEFDDEEWENCHTVGDFIQLVENRMAAGSRRGSGSHAGTSAGATRPRKTSRE